MAKQKAFTLIELLVVIMSMGSDKAGTWWPAHNCQCDGDDVCFFFGRGTQTY